MAARSGTGNVPGAKKNALVYADLDIQRQGASQRGKTVAVGLIRSRVLGVSVGPQRQPGVLDHQAGQELELPLGARRQVNLGRLGSGVHAILEVHLELATLGVTVQSGRRRPDRG